MLGQPDYRSQITFPFLQVAFYWAEAHCVVPDGFRKGDLWQFTGWQEWCFANAYRVREGAISCLAPDGSPVVVDGHEVRPSSAFHWRRSQIVLPQKAGKAPYTSVRICTEAVGPAIFVGWASGGELYRCSDHRCPCGFVYEYQPGEAMGRPWPTPLIQITAFSEDQTDNIYSSLKPMIDDGPLHELIPRTGEEFIRLPGGRIDTVTSNARSRLGQRVTFVAQDETGIWTKSNGMIEVAETQRRGVGGMGGRSEETTNAWDPTESSVAQRTERAKTGDIFRHHPMAEKGLSYRTKDTRRKIHQYVYEHCPWIDLDAIEGEAAELMEEDPAQAERFFGNRIVAGGGPAFDIGHWDSLKAPRQVPAGETIVIGVDGARYNDAVAVVACHVKSGYVWPLVIVERPDNLSKELEAEYEHDQRRIDGAVREAFATWDVWRLYTDPDYLDYLLQGWQNEFGDKRIVEWRTYRPRQIAWAVRNFRDSVKSGQVSHPGNEILDRHIGNARLKELTVLDDKERPMHTLAKDSWRSPRKIDGAMAAVLAWEARTDAIAANAVWMGSVAPTGPEPEPAKPSSWTPGTAPSIGSLVMDEAGAPMGSLS